MSRKPLSPSQPSANDDLPLRMGFTAWVDLHRSGIAEVLAYSRHLDRHFASLGLVRSMNPLHMLVWSPERSLTEEDQADLIEWMATEPRVLRVRFGRLRSHVGIPSVHGHDREFLAQTSDPEWLAVFRRYRSLKLEAQSVLELFQQAASAPGRA